MMEASCFEFLLLLHVIMKCNFFQGTWEFLLHTGCCLVVLVDIVVVLEHWLSSKVDIYALFFLFIQYVGNLLPSFSCGGNFPR